MKKGNFFIVALSLIVLTFGYTKTCEGKAGTKKISLSIVHPTQFSIGLNSIEKKIKDIEKAQKKGKLKKYLSKKVAPAILAPSGMYHIIDRHHTAYALLNSNIDESDKKLHVYLLKDLSDSSMEEFKEYMLENKYCYLRDENDLEREFEELPRSLDELTNDPYRSLAWEVREIGGFKKVNVPYLEFIWGRFFRRMGIQIGSSDRESVKLKVKQAYNLSRSQAASHLPGHKSKSN